MDSIHEHGGRDPEVPVVAGAHRPTPSASQPAGQLASHPVLHPLLAILILTLVTQLGSLAYNIRTAAQVADSSGPNLLFAVATGMILLSILTVPPAALGLRLGAPFGLGAPLLTDLLQRRSGSVARFGREAILAIPLGLGIGVVLLILRMATEHHLPPSLPAFGHRGVVGGLLASAGAAVAEEVWIRLGVMTVFVWLFARAFRYSEVRPAVAWSANVFAALAFGLLHLPQLAQYGGATPIGISGTMLGNGIVGVACGWLYWRRSLLAAMMGHFAVDLVLHVLTAL